MGSNSVEEFYINNECSIKQEDEFPANNEMLIEDSDEDSVHMLADEEVVLIEDSDRDSMHMLPDKISQEISEDDKSHIYPTDRFIYDSSTDESQTGDAIDTESFAKRYLLTDNTCTICEMEFKFRMDFVQHINQFHPTENSLISEQVELTSDNKDLRDPQTIVDFKQTQNGGNDKTALKDFEQLLEIKKEDEEHNSDNDTRHIFDLLEISKTEFPEIKHPESQLEDNSIKNKLEYESSSTDLEQMQDTDDEDYLPENIYQCGVCQKIFNGKYVLIKHAKQFHPNEKALKCQHCEELFTNVRPFSHHLRYHNKILQNKRRKEKKKNRKQICRFCTKNFKNSKELKMHLKVHTGKQPYLSHFKQNSKTSNKITNVACKFCFQKFENIFQMKNHLRTHIKQCSYSCLLCKKSYKRMNDLKKHRSFVLFNIVKRSRSILQKIQNPYMKTSHKNGISCVACQKVFNYQGLVQHCKQDHPNIDDFKCQFCMILFSNLITLSCHMRIHTAMSKKYMCKFCYKNFNHKSHLQLHLRKHTGERPYRCNSCDKSFKQKCHLNEHFKRRHIKGENKGDKNAVKDLSSKQFNERPYSCSVCKKAFKQNIHLKNHFFRKHFNAVQQSDTIGSKWELKQYSCELCFKSFDQKSNLKSHMRIHTGERPYRCSFCEKSFTQSCNLQNHLKRKHMKDGNADALRKYGCNLCPKFFNCRSNLINHLRIHTGERPYRCDMCEKTFNQKGNLQQHIATHLNGNPTNVIESNNNIANAVAGEYVCEYCFKCFTFKSYLIIHLRIHTGERPFNCSLCENTFSQKSNLHQHIRTTHKMAELPKRHYCKVCGMSFEKYSFLKTHLKTHADEEPYHCKICTQTFVQMDQLEKHIESRHYKHVCKVCLKCFDSKHMLKRHLLVHTGERPYPCTLCEKAFNQNSNLQSHMRSHIKENSIDNIEVLNFQIPINDDNQLQERLLEINVCDNEEVLKCHTVVNTKEHSSPRPLQLHMKSHLREKSIDNTELLNFQTPIKDDNQLQKDLSDTYVCDNEESLNFQMPIKDDNQYQQDLTRKFVCDFCNKPFSQKANLQVHIRIHTGERPYHCSSCEKTFNQKSQLQKHFKSQHLETNNGYNKCGVCQREFYRVQALAKHATIFHPNEKAFECKVCGECFYNVASRNSHMSFHNVLTEFQCVDENGEYVSTNSQDITQV